MNDMEHAETFGQRHAAMRAMMRGATYMLALLMPLSVFFSVGTSANREVFALYAQRGFYLSDIPLALLLLLALTGYVPWRRGPWLVTVPLIVLCLLAFLSIPQALSSTYAFYVAVRWLLALFLFFWFLQPLVPTSHFAAVLALSLGVHAAVGIAQVLLQQPLNLPGELTARPGVPGAAIILVDGVRWLRAYGLTFHPNVLGGFAATAILLMLPALRKLPAIGLWWLLWLALFVSFSRSAGLALVLVLPLALWAVAGKDASGRKQIAIALAGLLVLSIAFAGVARDHVSSRLGSLADVLVGGQAPVRPEEPSQDVEAFSLTERAELIDVAWAMIGERPLRGVGAGNFPLVIPHTHPWMRAQAVHSVPLLLAAEVGIIGGILWLVIMVAVAVRFIWHARRANPWLLCAICACLALAVISLFDGYPWSLNSGLSLTAAFLGLASRAPRDAN